LIRAFAETCPEHAFATYDLTDIVHAGYYEPDDPIAELATQSLIGEYPRHGKIIILTEGKMDRRILEDSLRLLYPHLADYFSFMDFETSKAEGGVGYSRSEEKYQGVLVNKQAVHSRFFDKLEVCKREPGRLEEFDWAILELFLSGCLPRSTEFATTQA
jgi:hypothetical protein